MKTPSFNWVAAAVIMIHEQQLWWCQSKGTCGMSPKAIHWHDEFSHELLNGCCVKYQARYSWKRSPLNEKRHATWSEKNLIGCDWTGSTILLLLFFVSTFFKLFKTKLDWRKDASLGGHYFEEHSTTKLIFFWWTVSQLIELANQLVSEISIFKRIRALAHLSTYTDHYILCSSNWYIQFSQKNNDIYQKL